MNFIWAILFGLLHFLVFALTGIVLCLTLVFIPVGIKCLKLSVVFLKPFSYVVEIDPSARIKSNIAWGIFFGASTAAELFLFGILMCVTLIGIPFGLQCFKLAKLVYAPCGATVAKV